MAGRTCCVCGSVMRAAGPSWRFRCRRCGTESSSLDVTINASHAIDEAQRAEGLESLRRQNNDAILRWLGEWGMDPDARLLDVGCAHGWFLSAATASGVAASGIEPDQAIAEKAVELGHDVRIGYFPDALHDGETFGVITFNDVLEHIPDLRAAVEESARRLEPGGLLVVNMPDRSGIVYRLASVARRLGVASVFERLWQVGLPSPHLWYLDARGLVALAESVGLSCVSVASLPSIDRRGLWARAHFDRTPSVVTVLSVAVGWLAAPVLNSRRFSDIMLVALRRPEQPAAQGEHD